MANGLVERRRWDLFSCAIFFGPESDHCLVLSVCQSPFFVKDLSKFLHGFLQVVTWICQNIYMDFSNMSHRFVNVATCICWSCYVDLSKLFCVFFALLNQAEV